MANGEAGECYWTTCFRREGEAVYTYEGKFPLDSEAYAYYNTILLPRLAAEEPETNWQTDVKRLCCGRPLPGQDG